MLTRRGLFGVFAGAVAAVFGVKSAPTLALRADAFSLVSAGLECQPKHILRYDVIYGFSNLTSATSCVLVD